LILNLFVSAVSFFHYARGGYFSWKLFFPFVITSIPASFLGSMISLDAMVYKKVLGVLLIFPILRLFGAFGGDKGGLKDVVLPVALISGAAIGLLSGMIGIGGGIILSPLILLFRWGNIKQAAAASALFIFVNSISGLGGLFWKGAAPDPWLPLWIAVALSGGFAGAYLGRAKFNKTALRFILSVVLLIASVKLLIV
jgi:uncharacterized protein